MRRHVLLLQYLLLHLTERRFINPVLTRQSPHRVQNVHVEVRGPLEDGAGPPVEVEEAGEADILAGAGEGGGRVVGGHHHEARGSEHVCQGEGGGYQAMCQGGDLTGWELDDHVGRPGEHLGLGQLPHHSAVMAFTIWLSELTLNPII